jgi:hypothetical protein
VGQFAEVECKEFIVLILANIKTFAHAQELIVVKQERYSGSRKNILRKVVNEHAFLTVTNI